MMNSFRLTRLKNFYARHKYIPSYAKMLRLFNVSSKNAAYKIVQRFIQQGYLVKEDKQLIPTRAFLSMPYVGLIKAGFPTGAEETVDFMSLDDYLIEDPSRSFLLKVSGDSLSGIGVLPGDMVVVHRTREASNGDIVLAQIDREWTLKILEQKGDTTLLISANPKYPPFRAQEELEIHGIVKAVIRKFQ